MVNNNLIIIDNYDSFTHTIKNYFETLHVPTEIIKNDDPILKKLDELSPAFLVLSPGPGNPDDAGFTLDVIKQYYTQYPILGICLGHQCIAQAFGGRVIHASEVMHGKQSIIYHEQKGLFKGVPEQFTATRYHSLQVYSNCFPEELEITAWTYDNLNNNVIMGLQHRAYPLYGVQYHPEAILTQHGFLLLQNFVTLGLSWKTQSVS